MHCLYPRVLRNTAVSLIFLAAGLALSVQALAGTIGDSLLAKLDQAAPDTPIEIIVSFQGDDPLTGEELSLLQSLGLSGIYFQELPIAGVVANPDQILTLADAPGVRSLWLNDRLELENAEATALTGVDRLQTDANLRNGIGLPISGKGIGIMINDSGVDATHPDLQFPHKTVQNVYAGANLNAVDSMLPITWIEGVPDSDFASGHGTHVAGTAGGTGAASGGTQAGVAAGADMIGYGSGAVLFILDTLGAFDYALVNQFQHNIRVINNSWGNTGDVGTPFDPDDPVNIATKKLADRGVITVFSAGNSGSGEGTITGNFKKAPWVVTVAAANKDGTLASFSSRGTRNGGDEVTIGGEDFTWVDRPNVTAPGVDIVSTMSTTNTLGTPVNLSYATMSGTSMAAPHVAGIVALVLEANPMLDWRDVIEIFETTATNMPGYEDWEAGAGMINAHAAVAMAAGKRDDFGLVQNLKREFNAAVNESRIDGPDFELFFSPLLLEPDVESFTVEAGMSTVIASANVSDNTVALVLTDPEGNRFGSSISLPLLGPNIAVTAPARPGEWTIEVRGIGSVSGVALDPLGLTNGTALPGSVNTSVSFMQVDGFTGLDDIDGHPARGIIEFAVANRLVDSRTGGVYEPDAPLTRAELADYLTMGGGVRQFRPTDGSDSFIDVTGIELAAAEATAARGGALRDLHHVQNAIVLNEGAGEFRPEDGVARAALAYSLIQALGLENVAAELETVLAGEPITVAFQGDRIALEDDADVPAGLRGHVQLALDLQVMGARFSLEQGPFDLFPTIKAHFDPLAAVDRAGYAFAKTNWLDRFRQGSEPAGSRS